MKDKLENKKSKMLWSVEDVWNEQLGLSKRYPPKVRDYISPSDIGKDYWGRYQKMMGVEETNPFEYRVLRIFAAGNEFHHLLNNVFRASGILLNTQDEPDEQGRNQWSIIPETDKTLKVLGKYDCLAGGIPNLEQTKEHCERIGLSEFVANRTIKMVEKLLEVYPNGLPKILYEFKSVNSMAFWGKKNYLQDAYHWHTLQNYAYLKANSIPEGRVLYISKDDLTIAEFQVLYPDEKLEAELQKDLEEMTHYIKTKTEPPKPDYVVLNPLKKLRFQKDKKKIVLEGCYEANWEVSRSNFFTLMTGFKTEKEWQKSIRKEISEKNSQLKLKYLAGDSNLVSKKNVIQKAN